MGNCCCRQSKPCNSEEETSGLLNNATKTTVTPAESEVGACVQYNSSVKQLSEDNANNKKEGKLEVVVNVQRLQGASPRKPTVEDVTKATKNGPLHSKCSQTKSPSPRPCIDNALQTISIPTVQDRDKGDAATVTSPEKSPSDPALKECAIATEGKVSIEVQSYVPCALEEPSAVVKNDISEAAATQAEKKCLDAPCSPKAQILTENLIVQAADAGADSGAGLVHTVDAPSEEGFHGKEDVPVNDSEVTLKAYEESSVPSKGDENWVQSTSSGNISRPLSPSSGFVTDSVMKVVNSEKMVTTATNTDDTPSDLSHASHMASPAPVATGAKQSSLTDNISALPEETVAKRHSGISLKSYEEKKVTLCEQIGLTEVPSLDDLIGEEEEKVELERKEFCQTKAIAKEGESDELGLNGEMKQGLDGEDKHKVEQGLKVEVKQGLELEVKQGLEVEKKQGLVVEVKQGLEMEEKQGLEMEEKQGLEMEVEKKQGLKVEVEEKQGLEVEKKQGLKVEVEKKQGLKVEVEEKQGLKVEEKQSLKLEVEEKQGLVVEEEIQGLLVKVEEKQGLEVEEEMQGMLVKVEEKQGLLVKVEEKQGLLVEVEEKQVMEVEENQGLEVDVEENQGLEVEEKQGLEVEVKQGLEGKQGPSTSAKVEVLSGKQLNACAEQDIASSEEDLYRGEEELSPGVQVKLATQEPLFEITLPKVEDRCSLAAPVDILSYSKREWKGNTAKSILIRKGYAELAQRFESLRRVRGDNFCALRATLFQVLSLSTRLPAWLEDISMLPQELQSRGRLIDHWLFPVECRQGEGPEDAVQQLKRYMELLQTRWQSAVSCSSPEERQRLCERVFQGGEEELGLMEALKVLMLGRALELHASMQQGQDVPIFCWLLFARDSSDCPRSFLSNHLSQVGFSGGLEQVEMFLLGYSLQCTIQAYRLYMADTEEFVTYYPDDHKDDWPGVCLVTEDDRHYNVPVGETVGLQVP
ncbi:uncharacterized protein LOC134035103 isoform X5 [Osmerus eperlanus]|uniref:uncharacterized protein LOC134035103 isoform X5 n=1 Tax=Osmerus eperlanus TaxID=29151 RepID=UPI002E0EE719